jgi:tol-pal system protein YbgF
MKSRSGFVLHVASVACVSFFPAMTQGCAHSDGPEARKLAQLRDDIRRVQTDHERLEQRLSVLEVGAADSQKQGTSAFLGSPDGGAKLRVVRLRPDGTEERATTGDASSTSATRAGEPPASVPGSASASVSTEDGTPRPSIRVTGGGARTSRGSARGSAGSASDQIEQTEPDEGAPRVRANAPRPSALDPEAKRAYDAALALVNARQYDRALEAFAGFLVRYPDHPNADNALYWRGESYFAQGDYSRAAEQFDGAITRFPLGNKVPDALLKLGICQTKLGLGSKAKITFERLAREFPRSEAARRIPREENP